MYPKPFLFNFAHFGRFSFDSVIERSGSGWNAEEELLKGPHRRSGEGIGNQVEIICPAVAKQAFNSV
jgi:hypothetical protein